MIGYIFLVVLVILFIIFVIKKSKNTDEDFDRRLNNTQSFWKKCCAKLKGKEYGI